MTLFDDHFLTEKRYLFFFKQKIKIFFTDIELSYFEALWKEERIYITFKKGTNSHQKYKSDNLIYHIPHNEWRKIAQKKQIPLQIDYSLSEQIIDDYDNFVSYKIQKDINDDTKSVSLKTIKDYANNHSQILEYVGETIFENFPIDNILKDEQIYCLEYKILLGEMGYGSLTYIINKYDGLIGRINVDVPSIDFEPIVQIICKDLNLEYEKYE